MTSRSEFRGTVDQDLYLAPGGREVQAVITITAHGDLAGEIRLRLWTPVGATVRSLRQTAPTLLDLTEHRVDSGPLTGDYPAGPWIGSTEYHLRLDIEPGEVGDEKLACRMTLVHTGAGESERAPRQNFRHTEPDGNVIHFTSARIRALWCDDLLSSTVAGEIDDPDTGTFEIIGTDTREMQSLDVESTRTTLLGRSAQEPS